MDKKFDWTPHIVADERIPPGMLLLATPGHVIGYSVQTGRATEKRRGRDGQWGDIRPLDLDEPR